MHRFRAMTLACLLMSATASATSVTPQAVISSPDRRIVVVASVAGDVTYTVSLDGQEVLRKSRLGVLRDDADFTQGLDVTANYQRRLAQLEKVEDVYDLATIKRRHNVYRANRRVLEVQTLKGARMDIEFQVSNDGFAFRYVFPETDAKVRRITREATSFNFPAGARAFLQPLAAPKSGWNESNPSYEEVYQRDQVMGTPSPLGGPYVFPGLVPRRRYLAAGERNRSRAQLLRRAAAATVAQQRVPHRLSHRSRIRERWAGRAGIHAAVEDTVADRGRR